VSKQHLHRRLPSSRTLYAVCPCSRELVVGLDEDALDDVDGVDEDRERGEAAEDGESSLLGRVEPLVSVHAFLR